jgi:hypothetical protein
MKQNKNFYKILTFVLLALAFAIFGIMLVVLLV